MECVPPHILALLDISKESEDVMIFLQSLIEYGWLQDQESFQIDNYIGVSDTGEQAVLGLQIALEDFRSTLNVETPFSNLILATISTTIKQLKDSRNFYMQQVSSQIENLKQISKHIFEQAEGLKRKAAQFIQEESDKRRELNNDITQRIRSYKVHHPTSNNPA